MAGAFPLFIAGRYLVARRRGVFVMLVFMISVGGLALGVAATVVTLSIMNGFQTDLRSKILGISPHIVLVTEGQRPMPPSPPLAASIGDLSRVRAVAPFVYGQVIIKSRLRSTGVILKGISIDEEKKVTGLASAVKRGVFAELKFSSLSRKELPGVLLGHELARTLSVSIGDDVALMASDSPSASTEMVPRVTKCCVSGIFESGMYEYDSNFVFSSLGAAQKALGMESMITGYAARLSNEFEADSAAAELQQKLGFGYFVNSWSRMNRSLFSALKLEKIMMFIVLTLITLVAAFNIASTLILLTVDKTKDIGILKAIGATDAGIRKVFMLQGGFIGIIGIALGEFLGVALSLIVKKYRIIELPPDVYYISTVPVRIQMPDLVTVGLVAFLISVLASVYPAALASRLQPVEAIKSE